MTATCHSDGCRLLLATLRDTLWLISHQSQRSHSNNLLAATLAPCCPSSPRHTFRPHTQNHLPTSLISLLQTDQQGIEPERHRIATWYTTGKIECGHATLQGIPAFWHLWASSAPRPPYTHFVILIYETKCLHRTFPAKLTRA